MYIDYFLVHERIQIILAHDNFLFSGLITCIAPPAVPTNVITPVATAYTKHFFTFTTRSTKSQRRINFILDLDESIQHHGPTSV